MELWIYIFAGAVAGGMLAGGAIGHALGFRDGSRAADPTNQFKRDLAASRSLIGRDYSKGGRVS